ncbi:MAG: sigma-70 family RNA polymerase sigma factor [Flavobacteriales bacterium]|nr:sigma-70 family RNA polymerase sigma factor [Flavobacteriales bacterium]MBT6131774.1 sigma-70 family RNA polymerase sigma factor [Flavobacteriales bacterium]
MNTKDFNRIVDEWADPLFRFAISMSKDEDVAKDAVQDAFAKLWERKDDVNSTKVKSYLFTTVHHKVVDHFRRDQRHDDIETSGINPSTRQSSHDLQEVLHEALQTLPEIQRSVILLRDYEGYNYEEIVDGEIDGNDSTIYDSDDDDKKKQDHVSHWAGIRIGINGYLVNDALPIPNSIDFMELDYSRSISWDLNLIEKDFNLVKEHVELVTGLGMHFASYAFDSKHTTLLDTDPTLTAGVDSSISFTKNKLRATYLTAPLMLGFSTSTDEDKAFRLAAGGQVSWRIASKLKQQYTLKGDTKTLKDKNDFDLNPFLFHAVGSVGYGPVNIYAKYGLNELFKPGKLATPVTPFDIGVQLMF